MSYTPETEEVLRYLQEDTPDPLRLKSRKDAESWLISSVAATDLAVSIFRRHHADENWEASWAGRYGRNDVLAAWRVRNATREVASSR